MLLGLLLPWSWLLPWALGPRAGTGTRTSTFLLLWAGVVLVFFSLSRGKLAPYILPALLPLALLLGKSLCGLAEVARARAVDRGLRLSLWVWTLAGVSLTGLVLWPPSSLAQAVSRANLAFPYLLVAAAVFTLTPLIALVGRRLNLLLFGGRGPDPQRPVAPGSGPPESATLTQGNGPKVEISLAAGRCPGGGVPLFPGAFLL